jgi:HIV Tat-specific factor 1
VAKKAGIIQTDETDNPRVKIYTDEQGKPKGDALVKYALPTSVELAITLLDQSVFRPAAFAKPGSSSASASSSSAAAVENKDDVITVQRAEFEMKGSSFDSSRVDPRVAAAAANKKARLAGGAAAAEAARAKVGAMTAAEIQKQRLADSLSWAEDDDFADLVGGSSGSSRLRIVILKPMFTLAEAAAHPDGEEAFYDELKSEIGAEVETKVAKAVAASTGEGMNDGAGVRGGAAAMHGKGCIEKLTVFAGNELGPVAVKFRTAAHASACIALMNGRLFAGQKLQAFYFDGKTNYVVKPKDGNDEETQKRLDEFGDWIERGGDQHEE